MNLPEVGVQGVHSCQDQPRREGGGHIAARNSLAASQEGGWGRITARNSLAGGRGGRGHTAARNSLAGVVGRCREELPPNCLQEY